MVRARLLLPLGLLWSCGPAPRDSAIPTPPKGPPAAWFEAVRPGIAAHARAIVPHGEGFTAPLPGHVADARFDEHGMALQTSASDRALALRFRSWGPEGDVETVSPEPPQLGACLTEARPDGSCAQLLEYAHTGLTAWWVGLDRGVEFGWTVDAPPQGSTGPLVFETEVEGADWVAAAGEGAEIVDADGETWTVSEAMAWDADGQPLPARVEVIGHMLRVRVDATAALFPVTVDPVLEAATTAFTADPTTAGFGYSVAGAGDVNNDGFDDVIVGAYQLRASASAVGHAYVFYGTATGVSTTASTTITGTAGSGLGVSVSGAGDVNGDGFDDVIIGAHHYNFDIEYYGVGSATIHHGSATGVSSTASTTLPASPSVYFDSYGSTVSGAGDVNGDGYDDIIIGAPTAETGSRGTAFIHHGSPTGIPNTPATTVRGTAAGSYMLGISVSGAGDVNGDGYDDVIIGALSHTAGSTGYPGAAHVHHGSPTGVATSANTTIGHTVYEDFGRTVAGVGDIDGDGYDDVIVGAVAYSLGSSTFEGAAYVYHGSPAGIPTTETARIIGALAGDGLGVSVARAGDVNRDGFADVIIEARGYDSTSTANVGATYIHHGSSAGLESVAASIIPGRYTYPSGYSGAAAGAGDVNGDGFADVIIGDSELTSGTTRSAGGAYLHHGYTDDDGDGVRVGGDSTTPQDCDDTDPTVGVGVVGYRDTDGDGFGGTETTACLGDSGMSDTSTDCDDTRADVNPGASEVCDGSGIDEDCDGLADDADPSTDPSSFSTYHADSDGDGFGDPASSTRSCASPPAHVSDDSDCDDTREDIHPGAADIPDDRIDQDCDGTDATGTDGEGEGDSSGADAADSGEDGATDDPVAEASGEPGAPGAKETGCRSGPRSSPMWLILALILPIALRRAAYAKTALMHR